MNTPINPEGWLPGKTYSGVHHLNWGIKSGNHVYVSGMLSLDPYDGSLVGEGDIKTQTRRVMESIKTVIEAAGGTMDDVVFNTIYLRNLEDYNEMNSVYLEYFPNMLPARACLKVEMVKPEFLVELATVAVIS